MTEIGTPPRTLVVLCTDWPISALGYGPEVPAAVAERGRIFAATAAARELGVRLGQRRREAQSRCPELALLARDEAAERREFEPVIRVLESFCPAIALGAPGWAATATRGPARYFGGEQRFVARVAEALAALLGPPAAATGRGERLTFATARWRIGVADGPFAATLAAQSGQLVPEKETASFLAPLSVDNLANSELAGLLCRLGVRTLGGFAALEERDVLARFGVEGARLQNLARGLGDGALVPRAIVRPLVAEVVPDPPIGRVDEAAFAVRALAGDLAHQLSTSGLACSLLEVAVELSDGEQVIRRWSHDGPFSASVVAERLRFQLEVFLLQRATPDEGDRYEEQQREIVRLRLEALETGADTGRSFELWGRPQWSDERVGRTFARLQGIAGVGAVLRPVLVGGRGPRERVRLIPFGEALPASTPLAGAPWPGHLPAPSPTLLEDGTAVRVLDADGAAVVVNARGVLRAPPAAVVLDGLSPLAVRTFGGPWPTDERWWEPARRRRQARIQVVLEDGQALLLSLESGCWHLEGRYD